MGSAASTEWKEGEIGSVGSGSEMIRELGAGADARKGQMVIFIREQGRKTRAWGLRGEEETRKP